MSQHDPRRWAKDVSASHCLSCNVAFSVLTRRHHCRSCGEIFCEQCCKAMLVLPGPPADASENRREKVRVCGSCVKVCEAAAEKAAAIASSGGGDGGVAVPPGAAATEVVRFAWYWAMLASNVATPTVRKQRALTKANNLLLIDIPALKDEVRRHMTSSGGKAQPPHPPGTPTAAGGASNDNNLLTKSASGGGSPRHGGNNNNNNNNNNTWEDVQPPRQPDGAAPPPTTGGSIHQLLSNASPAEAMAHFFSAASTSRLGRLEERIERFTNKAVNILRIMERHSLTHFFLEMYRHLCELLMTSFSAHVSTTLANKTTTAGSAEAQHAKSVRRLQLHGADVQLAASAALARTVLHLESLRMPSTLLDGASKGAAGLATSFVGCELLDDIAEQMAVAVTMRYQEQVCSLTEASSEVLATTAAARIHHRVHAHATASEDDFAVLLNHVALEDYLFDAILNERPAGVLEQALHTRLRDIDTRWTDHGALSCCGLATSDGLFFDSIYLDSTSETSSKLPAARLRHNTTAAHQEASDAAGSGATTHNNNVVTNTTTVTALQATTSVASKYYYRQGTSAEALAMKMTPTGRTRYSPSPLWSAQMLFEQHQTLCRRRDAILSSYSRVPFSDTATSSWASLLGGAATAGASHTSVQAQRWSSPAATTVRSSSSVGVLSFQRESIAFRVEQLRSAVRLCKDYVANTESLRSILVRRYRSMYQELERVQTNMEELKQRAEDIQDTPRASAESRGLLMAIDRIAALNRSEHVQSRIDAFHRYHRFLNPTSDVPTAATVFYLHLRTKLLEVLLAASRMELQDDPVTLMGNLVPYSSRVALALDAMNAQASQSPIMKSWSLPDVVDRHTERMARVLADRLRDSVDVLSPASIVVFGDCCVARLLYLFSHTEDVVSAIAVAAPSSSSAGPSPASGRGRAASRIADSVNSQKFDWLLEVAVVERMECVELFDTIVKARKVFLSSVDHKSTLCEQGILTKSGVCSADGKWYAGTRETHGANLIHHRGPKYGVLHAFPGEIERKKLLRAAPDWSVDLRHVLKPKRTLSFLRGGNSNEPVIVPALIKPPPPPDCNTMHWGSSLLSVGPRLVGPGEVVGVTLFPRSKTCSMVTLGGPERSEIGFIALTGEGGKLTDATTGVTNSGDAADQPQPHQGEQQQQDAATAAGEGTAVIKSFRCSTAGTLIIAAEFNGILLIGNAVRVRPGRVDWPHHCSVAMVPANTVVAGETVTVTMTLRDEYNNVTSTTSPEDFSISIDNNGEAVVASTIVEEVEGKFKFVFVPTNEGPVRVSITAAGVTMATARASHRHPSSWTSTGASAEGAAQAPPPVSTIPPLLCVAGQPDFKNSMFSFEEWDVVAGSTVRGNLYLRDVFGNKVEAEDEHPLIEMINGGTCQVPSERVNRGEYIFSICPIKQGTAILRATSLRSFASLIARVNVVAPTSNIDWTHSSLSCLSKVLFAGEVAEFHIVMRDVFGNSIASDVKPQEFECWLRYVDGEEASNAIKAALTSSFSAPGELSVEQRADGSSKGSRMTSVIRATHVTGSGASFAFRVTPGAVGSVIACAAFRGASLESCPMTVRSAPLSWPTSKVTVASEALVGAWVPVMIDCRDRFGNPSDAQESDFSVVAFHDASSNRLETTTTAIIKNKPVTGSGSSFAFQVMGTKTGVLRVVVTYAGYLKHECSVTLLPMPAVWSTTELFVRCAAPPPPSSSPLSPQLKSTTTTSGASVHVVAGEVLKVGVLFRDQHGNWTHKPKSVAPSSSSVASALDEIADNSNDVNVATTATQLFIDNEGTTIAVDVASGEATDDPEATWCQALYHVRPTVAGRVNVSAAWPNEQEVKHVRATVVPHVIDWGRCVVTPIISGGGSASPSAAANASANQTRSSGVHHHNPDASSGAAPEGGLLAVVAGTSVAIKVRFYDRFGNPVEVNANALAIGAANATTDHRNASVELLCDVRVAGTKNEIMLQCVPELSGTLRIHLQLDTKTEPERYGCGTAGEPKVVEYHVSAAPLDWLGKSFMVRPASSGSPAVAAASQEQQDDGGEATAAAVVAGESFLVELYLRDAFSNPIFYDDWEDGTPLVPPCPFTVELVESATTITNSPKAQHRRLHSTLSPPADAVTFDSNRALESSGRPTTSEGSTSSPCLSTKGFSWDVKSKEQGALVAQLVANVSGTATVNVQCEGVKRTPLSVPVAAATTSWDDSELVWAPASMSVGVPAVCSILWRDRFGNLTAVDNPRREALVATLHETPRRLLPAQDALCPLIPPPEQPKVATTTVLSVAEDYTLSATTTLAGEARITVARCDTEAAGASSSPLEASCIAVRAAAVSWPQSLLAIVPAPSERTGEATTKAATRVAGEAVEYLLALRDRYDNESDHNVTSAERDLRVQVLLAGATGPPASIRAATRGAINDAEAAHFIISFVPTIAGSYTISAGLASDSETCDLITTCDVGPASVCWTNHTNLFSDAETVTAGASVFLQLQCRDAFANATAVGVDTAQLVFRLSLDAPWCEAATRLPSTSVGSVVGRGAEPNTGVTVVDVFPLPQETGLFGATLEVTRSGSLVVHVSHAGDEANSVTCDETIEVGPSSALWEHSSAVVVTAAGRDDGSGAQVVVAGDVAVFGLLLRDRYGNLLSPLLPPQEPSAMGGGSGALRTRSKSSLQVEQKRAAAVAEDSSQLARGGGGSQDDLTDDFAADGSSLHGALIADFHQQELPQLRMTCENDNTDPGRLEWQTLSSHPNEHRRRSLEIVVDPVATTAAPASVPADHIGAHASILLRVRPTVAGACRLRVAHTASEHILTAALGRVACGCIVKGDIVDPMATTTRAGETVSFHLKLRDQCDNWILAAPEDEGRLGQQLLLKAFSNTEAKQLQQHKTGGSGCEVRGLTWKLAASGNGQLSLNVTPTVAEFLSMTLCLSSPPCDPVLQIEALHVRPAPIAASNCIWDVTKTASGAPQGQAMAGERYHAALTAYDAYRNLIPDVLAELTVAATKPTRLPLSTLQCINGTARPDVVVWDPATMESDEDEATNATALQSRQAVRFTVTLAEKGTVSMVLVDSKGAKAATDAAAVLPAPLHWPSCTVRFSDDALTLGSATNVLVQLRDRFLNPVEGNSNLFRLVVVNNGHPFVVRGPDDAPQRSTQQELGANEQHDGHNDTNKQDEGNVVGNRRQPSLPPNSGTAASSTIAPPFDLDALPSLPDCEGFVTRRGKTLLCEVKPMHRGTLLCHVLYDAAASHQHHHHSADDDAPKVTASINVV